MNNHQFGGDGKTNEKFLYYAWKYAILMKNQEYSFSERKYYFYIHNYKKKMKASWLPFKTDTDQYQC